MSISLRVVVLFLLKRSTNGSTITLTAYPSGQEISYNGSGTLQNTTTYYSLGGRLIGELMGSSSQTNIFLTDALGSVITTFSNVAGTASLIGSRLYGPYGNTRYSQGPMNTSKGFTGQYSDSLSGLDYYNARYYDPQAGVFLSADTVEGNMQGMNPYAYVGGNPETANDPTGQYHARDEGCGGGPPPPPSEGTVQGRRLYGYCGGNAPTDEGPTPPNQYQLEDDANAYSHHGTPTWGRGVSGLPTLIYLRLYDQTSLAYLEAVSPKVEMLVKGELAQEANTLLTEAGDDGIDWNSSNAMKMLHFILVTLSIPVVIMSTGAGMEGHPDMSASFSGAGACSFTPDTAVATEHGKQTIGTVHVGEKVLAYNPKTHKMELQPIVHVWIHKDDDLVDLTITTPSKKGTTGKTTSSQSEVIHTNKKHPFLTIEHGFLAVAQIKVGMHVLRANGETGIITKWVLVSGSQVMYNLEIAHDHTFTIGDGQWIVHNDCVPRKMATKILKAYDSEDPGPHTEGEAALLILTNPEGDFQVISFNKKFNGPTGTIGEIDVETPGLIVEAKSGKTWDDDYDGQINKLQTHPVMNPEGKPVVIYAPNMDDAGLARAAATGAFVATNEDELISYVAIYG